MIEIIIKKKHKISIKYCHNFHGGETVSEWENSLFIKFLGNFTIPRVEIKVSWHFDDQRHLIVILRFLPVSYSFHYKNLWESICLWSSTITHGFWLDKVSKYHIDSLAKMIVQRATSSLLGPSEDGTFDTSF